MREAARQATESKQLQLRDVESWGEREEAEEDAPRKTLHGSLLESSLVAGGDGPLHPIRRSPARAEITADLQRSRQMIG